MAPATDEVASLCGSPAQSHTVGTTMPEPTVRTHSLLILLVAVTLTSFAACSASHTTARHATPAPTNTASAPTATPNPAAITVHGTRLYHQGHPVTLIGADRSSLEYSCSGDGHFGIADFQAMQSWGMNTVRIALSSEFWVNAGGMCPNYQQTVTQAVANARSAGMFVILDLQWSAPFELSADQTGGGGQCPLPDSGKDVAFWQDLASHYRSDLGVLFDLYGEPFGVSWATWRDGGTVSLGCYIISAPSHPVEGGTYQAIGMQALVDKVRAIAPENVIIVGGLSFGYDLSGVRQGYALKGTNLVYDTHPFDYESKQPSDWPAAFGDTAQTYAVIADEFGSSSCGTSYISQAISYFNAHHISWLAWAWGPDGCGEPSLLASWPDTPSVPYGSYIKQQMLAAAQSAG